MYPTAMVPYNQAINNPFNYPTPYYKQYGNCGQGMNGGGTGTGTGPCSGCNTGNVILNINFPNTFTGTVETITGETVPNILKNNVVVGGTDNADGNQVTECLCRSHTQRLSSGRARAHS
jgi:hypothetical protein